MSRRRQATKRPLAADPKFHSPLVTRLVNTVMRCGKKNTAERIVYGAFGQLTANNTTARAMIHPRASERTVACSASR